MDERFNLPEPDNHDPEDSKDLGQRFLHSVAGKAATIIATGTFAAVALGGAESNPLPGQQDRSDVPAHTYDKDGYPEPVKIAKHLLWQAKNADPNNYKEVSDRIWTGVIVLPPGTVMYQAPDEAFPSADSRQKLGVGKFVVPKDESLVIELPRMLSFNDGQVYIVTNLKNNKKTENRATDPAENYWYPLEKAQAEGAKFMTYKNFPPSLGTVTVDANNNLKFGTVEAKAVSVMETIKQDLLEKEQAAGKMVDTMPTAGR